MYQLSRALKSIKYVNELINDYDAYYTTSDTFSVYRIIEIFFASL